MILANGFSPIGGSVSQFSLAANLLHNPAAALLAPTRFAPATFNAALSHLAPRVQFASVARFADAAAWRTSLLSQVRVTRLSADPDTVPDDPTTEETPVDHDVDSTVDPDSAPTRRNSSGEFEYSGGGGDILDRGGSGNGRPNF